MTKLKTYLDRGGLLLAVNEGKGRRFAKSIETAGTTMYPTLTWRNLPATHWAYTTHSPVKGRPPKLRGLSNGVRELIVLADKADLARTYQVRDMDNRPHFETGANLFFYASERTRLRPRLPVAKPPAVSHATPAMTARVVHASYDGAWNPEPAALDAFATAAGDRGIRVDVAAHPLMTIDTLDPRPTLIVVQGVDAREFATEEQRALRAYVDSGGVVLFETPGGMGGFTESAETMAAALWGRDIEPMRQSRIVTGDAKAGLPSIGRVGYRAFALERFGARETTPRLRGLIVDGQPRVLFSREDIAHALLDQPCWGVSGYTTQSARDVLGNIVRHAVAVGEDESPR